MLLGMYINGKLVDSSLLSMPMMQNGGQRDLYLQGTANDLLEKWSDLLKDQTIQPQFYIKGQLDLQ